MKRMYKKNMSLSFFIIIILLYCSSSITQTDKANSNQDSLPTLEIPNGKKIYLEIVQDPEARAYGLMFRKELPPDNGMLFVFDESDFHSFWMKNTLIPLDIIWLDKDFKIVYFYQNVPPCKHDPCSSYAPMRKAKYVLEVNAGFIKKESLSIGDVMIPDKNTRILIWQKTI